MPRHRRTEHPTALKTFTDAELIEELSRRTIARDRERARSWCDDCANFGAWEGVTKMPKNFNPCRKGHEMQFQEPHGYGDDPNWGFYRLVCADRASFKEGSGR